MRRDTGPHASIDGPRPWPSRPPPAHGSPRAWACARPAAASRARATRSSSPCWRRAPTPSSPTVAVGLPIEPRLQVGVGWSRSARPPVGCSRARCRCGAPAAAWIGVGLLVGFAVWCGITLLWSVAPDRTWAEINRGVAYVLVARAGDRRRLERAACDRAPRRWLAVRRGRMRAVRARGKVMPGVSLFGIDFDNTGIVLAPARAAAVLERARRSSPCWRCRSRCAWRPTPRAGRASRRRGGARCTCC